MAGNKMPESLRRMVLSGRLKTPVQRGFVADEWDESLKAITNPTEDDLRLHQAAKFFAEQLEKLREVLEAIPPSAGDMPSQVRRAIGFVNREYLTVSKNLEVAFEERLAPVNEIICREFTLAEGINSATPESIVETIVDSLRFELSALLSREAGNDSSLPDDKALARIRQRGNLSFLYHALEEQWLNCLHHNWAVKEDMGATVIYPANQKTAIDFAVGQYRDSALKLELVQRLLHLYPEDHPIFATDLQGIAPLGTGRRKKYSVEAMPREVSRFVILRKLGAAEPELEPFVTRSLPNIGNLTVVELLKVWEALLLLAERLTERMPVGEHIHSPKMLEWFAPIENTSRMIDALERCTGLTREKCLKALQQFTWRNVRDSLWQRPLVNSGRQGELIIVLPALKIPDLRRSIEYWLGDGGADIAERGEAYEEYVRIEVARAITRNVALAGHAGVLPSEAKPLDPTIGDIDLLFWIDRTVVVGEIKCLLRPGSAHERYKYDNRILEAAEQAHRKALYVEQNPAWLDDISGVGRHFARAEIAVIPCVVINSPSGALRLASQVPVVDIHLITRYLEGFGVINATANGELAGDRVTFYSDAVHAASNLANFLVSPIHLPAYRDNVRWKANYQPDFRGQGLIFSVVEMLPIINIEHPPGEDEDGGGKVP